MIVRDHQRSTKINMSEIFSMGEAVKKIGVTKNTLYRWEKDNKIPKVKRDRNNHRLFTQEDIDQIIAFKNQVKDPNEETANENTAG